MRLYKQKRWGRVLHVGCGPGALLRYLAATTFYIEPDRNGESYRSCKTHLSWPW